MLSGLPFLKGGTILTIFIFSGKTPFYIKRLHKCFKGSLISPNHFLTTLKCISSYPGLLLVFNEKKAFFDSFIDCKFFSIIVCVLFRN